MWLLASIAYVRSGSSKNASSPLKATMASSLWHDALNSRLSKKGRVCFALSQFLGSLLRMNLRSLLPMRPGILYNRHDQQETYGRCVSRCAKPTTNYESLPIGNWRNH